MRFSILVTLFASLAIAGTYWYTRTASVCPAPISYRVGDIDASFEITKEEAKAKVKQAADMWESSSGRDLFVYDETADFTVSFVFDERQAIANSEAAQKKELDDKRAQNDAIMGSVESLQSEYETLSSNYKSRVD